MMNSPNRKKRYGIGIALLVLMVVVSLCVEPAETIDNNGTPVQPTPVQPTMTATQPPPDTQVDDDGAVSTMPTRIRAYFCSIYPNSCGITYSLDLAVIDSGWLIEKAYGALPVEAYAHFISPPARKAFIFWNDTAYPMPEEFTGFIRDSSITITTTSDASGIADLYAKVWEPSGVMGQPAVIVLYTSGDIPHTKNQISPQLADLIQSPEISRTGDGFRVMLSSWTPVGGVVRAWDMTVSKSGDVTATSRILGEFVGDAIPVAGDSAGDS
jgi:hypothetical protein